MSYITYQVQCKDCGEIYNTAFGIVGMRVIADPLRRCPKCRGELERCGDDWKWELQRRSRGQKVTTRKSRLGTGRDKVPPDSSKFPSSA